MLRFMPRRMSRLSKSPTPVPPYLVVAVEYGWEGFPELAAKDGGKGHVPFDQGKCMGSEEMRGK